MEEMAKMVQDEVWNVEEGKMVSIVRKSGLLRGCLQMHFEF